MAVEVIEKKKGSLTCGECGATVPAGASECPKCESTNIKKSLVIVRKAVGDVDDDLETEVDAGEVEEDEDLEDDDEEEESDDDEDEEESDDDDDDDDDEEEDDDDDEEEEEDEPVKVGKNLVGIEALNISTALAEDIAKVFSSKNPSREEYESVMTELNEVMDAASENWFSGKTVSKSNKTKPHIATIQGRVNGIINKEGENKVARPDGIDFDSLDEGTRKYIESLETEGVTKSKKTPISKRSDLPEDVRKSLKEADDIVEKDKKREWLEVAKSYSHFPGEPEELAKTLRSLSDADPKAFEELKKTLDAAEENLSQSEVFKSFGAPGSGGSKDDALEAKISKAMEATPGLTREQAEVSLMDGSVYKATA